jgi:hypothetical protein
MADSSSDIVSSVDLQEVKGTDLGIFMQFTDCR